MPSDDPSTPTFFDDPAVLRALIDEHTPRLRRKAMALCGDGDQADDIVQATWVQAHFKRTTYAGRGTFAAWIDTILLRTYINHHRAQRRREMHEYNSFTDPSVERDLPSISDASMQDDSDVQIGQLVRAILQLAPRERQVFVLRTIAGQPVRDVAAQLGRAEGTVKSTFAHAVTRLRELLTDKGE